MKFVKNVQAATVIHEPARISDLETVFQNFLVSLLGLIGITLFIVLIWGGFKYILSGGNPETTASARRTITLAIVGLIIILSGYLILVLIENITGARITEFNL